MMTDESFARLRRMVEPFARGSIAGQIMEPVTEAVDTLEDALGFIDQTIYANEDNPEPARWRNGEVLELLREIRAKLVAPAEAARCTCGVAWGTAEGPCVCEPEGEQ